MHSANQQSITGQLVSSHAVTHLPSLPPYCLTADSQLADIHPHNFLQLVLQLDLKVAQRRADWRVGVYIRVHGHLRSFENKKNIVIFSLKVIHDFNEVSHVTWLIAVHAAAYGVQAQQKLRCPAGVISLPTVHLSPCTSH